MAKVPVLVRVARVRRRGNGRFGPGRAAGTTGGAARQLRWSARRPARGQRARKLNGAGVAASPILARRPATLPRPVRLSALVPASDRQTGHRQGSHSVGQPVKSGQPVAVMRCRAPDGLCCGGRSGSGPERPCRHSRASRCSSHRTRFGFGQHRSAAFPSPLLNGPSVHRCRWNLWHPGSPARCADRYRSARLACVAIRPGCAWSRQAGAGVADTQWPCSHDPYRRPPPGGSVTVGIPVPSASADRRRSLRMGLRPAVSLMDLSYLPVARYRCTARLFASVFPIMERQAFPVRKRSIVRSWQAFATVSKIHIILKYQGFRSNI